MMSKQQKQKQKEDLPAVSVRFVNEVERQFAEEMGSSIEFTDHQKKLAQHMFLKVDQSLKDFEDRRRSKGQDKLPFKWDNVNMRGLALEAVYKVSLGLDALMKNHVHPVPYFNGHNKRYDIELTTGYKGLEFIAKKYAIDPPKKIIAELVHETDHFVPLKSNYEREVESYEYDIKEPFNRGEVIGGFGYLKYDDPTKNELVLVDKDDLDKAQEQAPMQIIWKKWPEKMQRKTVVRRTIDRVDLDPEKTNAKALVHEETGAAENKARREIEENANSQTIDIDPEPETEEIEAGQEEKEQQKEQPEPKPTQVKKEADTNSEEKEGPEQMAMTGTEGPNF